MREVIRRQHKALSTEDSYIGWLRRYIRALRDMPEGLSSEKKVEQFLTDLARHRDLSASSQNQAFNAKKVSVNEVVIFSAALGQRGRRAGSVLGGAATTPDALGCPS